MKSYRQELWFDIPARRAAPCFPGVIPAPSPRQPRVHPRVRAVKSRLFRAASCHLRAPLSLPSSDRYN